MCVSCARHERASLPPQPAAARARLPGLHHLRSGNGAIARKGMRSGGRVVEGARLESVYTVTPYRGFESLPLRHGPFHKGPQKTTGLDFFLLKTDA